MIYIDFPCRNEVEQVFKSFGFYSSMKTDIICPFPTFVNNAL